MIRGADIRARKPERFVTTTDSKLNYPVATNVLDQEFEATRPGEIWVSDITYVRTKNGWLYLTVIIELYDRKVIGWSMRKGLSAVETIIPAWLMATRKRPITQNLIFHSDRGIQYACKEFVNILNANMLITRSMSRRGNCWDNAVDESFFKTIKVEWLESWYNRRRRHSALGYKTIEELEINNYKFKNAA